MAMAIVITLEKNLPTPDAEAAYAKVKPARHWPAR